MSEEDQASARGSEEESEDVVDVHGKERDDVPMYDLRPLVTIREPELSHRASPLFRTVSQGGLEAQSAELIARLRKALADAEGMPSTSLASVTNAQDGWLRREPESAQQRRRSVGAANGGPTWLEYRQAYEQRLAEGARAIERIRREAVDSSDELDIYPDPRPLFAGGHDPHADRLGPKTKECDNASEAGESRVATGQVKA